MRMRTILAQIELTYTKGIRLVTYSAYYTVIPGFDSVLWKLALAMASSSFDFDRALAYALSCVKQEVLSLKDQQVEAVKLLSEGKDVFVWFSVKSVMDGMVVFFLTAARQSLSLVVDTVAYDVVFTLP